MPHRIRIGIVEDDMIIADTISDMLENLGYTVSWHAARYSQAVELLEETLPDLLLLDIQLTGRLDGIDLAKLVKEQFGIPFIFLTANADAATVDRAKAVKPMAYLTKPVTSSAVFSAVEIALDNYSQASLEKPPAENGHSAGTDSIFVKEGLQYRKLNFKEIVYLQSDAKYVTIILATGAKVLVRTPLPDLLRLLDPAIFLRVHRSYAVNRQHIEAVLHGEIKLQGQVVPVPCSKIYKEELYKALGISE